MKQIKVTDPSILAQLNSEPKKVTDQNLLSQLNDDQEESSSIPENESFLIKLPRNIFIGLTHAGRNLHNAPHDFVQGLEQGMPGIKEAFGQLPGPQISNKPLSDSLPYDAYDYAKTFGQKGEGTFLDNLIQKGFEYSPELMGIRSLISSGLKKYPITKGSATRQFKEAEKLLKNSEIPNMPLSINLIQESSNFLPKTFASRELLAKAAAGEPEPIFSLQSQIGHHARSLKKSPLAAEKLLAPEAQELKQRIFQELESSFRANGHNDIADLLKGGINDYRKYMKFKEKAGPIIKKLGIPGSALAVLSLGMNKGRKLISELTD